MIKFDLYDIMRLVWFDKCGFFLVILFSFEDVWLCLLISKFYTVSNDGDRFIWLVFFSIFSGNVADNTTGDVAVDQYHRYAVRNSLAYH